MNKAKEISALWKQIKPQIGELARLCHEAESHYEVTADAYQRGYENGFIAGHLKAEKSGQSFYEDGYHRGLNDAWNAAMKIVSIPTAELHTMFDKAVYYDTVFRDCTASEAIEKIRQYEQEQIQVGDEVIAASGKAVIIGINDNKGNARYIYSDSTLGFDNICNLSKTGRHFPEIAEVFAKMKESDNG